MHFTQIPGYDAHFLTGRRTGVTLGAVVRMTLCTRGHGVIPETVSCACFTPFSHPDRCTPQPSIADMYFGTFISKTSQCVSDDDDDDN